MILAKTKYGDIPVEGEVRGVWAVTPWLEDGVPVGETGAWVITHVPSGLAITAGFLEREKLIALAERLELLFPHDGEFGAADVFSIDLDSLTALRLEIEEAGFLICEA